ncbi:MAG: hypothetical protein ACOH5I_07635 [Oligoflexus sp.]
MSETNYEDLVVAIEHIAEGLERLAMLSLDLKRQIEAKQGAADTANIH